MAKTLNRDAMNRERARLPRQLCTSITWFMNQKGVNRAELARLMGVSPGRVSQILSGDDNLTLGTLAAVCVALDAHLDVKLVPNGGDPLRGGRVHPRSSSSPATVGSAAPVGSSADRGNLIPA